MLSQKTVRSKNAFDGRYKSGLASKFETQTFSYHGFSLDIFI